MSWSEVGNRCFARRYESFDVTVGVVAGTDGLLVIDTRGSLREAGELLSDLRSLSSAPVRWVVNTHWHFDHSFGNAAFAATFPGSEIYGHETVPGRLAAEQEQAKASLAQESEQWRQDMAELVVVPPSRTFSTLAAIDLGDRGVELVHPGLGHTDGDVVVRVPDADVLFAGDLVEQSGPPAYGPDSFPLDWPYTLETLSGLLTPSTAVVPGHGAACDLEFVRQQHENVLGVAELIRKLYESGVPADEALSAGGDDWPIPAERLADAVKRGYAQLRDSGSEPGPRTLPLLPS